MKIVNKAGISIEVDDERGLLLNGKSPTSVVDIGGGWYRASCVFCRVKHAKRASGARGRKKVLMLATKKYKFSFNFKQES